jgi:hypothetical protein
MTTPQGYIKRKVAQSAEEAIAQYTADHIKTIVKATVQRYVESFFSSEGGNRDLFKKVTQMGVKYITDKSFDPASDATVRKTQLARMFEQIRQELPCILIMDSGFEIFKQNWTGIDRTWVSNNEWYCRLLISRLMNITIAVGTRDQSSTDFLHGLLSVLFEELRFVAGGNRLTGNFEKGENWVVKLNSPKLGTVSQENIADDPKEKIWMFSLEIPDVLFEDSIQFSQPMDRLGPPRDGVLNEPDLGWTPPIIYLDDTLPINQPAQLLLDLFQPQYQKIIIANPNIATIDVRSRTINPRRLGTTELQIIRPRRDADGPPNEQTGSDYVVVASKSFRVTPT